MPDETLFTFEQIMTRADVAAYLRNVADKLEADGTLAFTAGGQSTEVAVPERLEFEVDVERSVGTGPTKVELEFELGWTEGADGDATGPGTLEIG
jgi:amphi-Trp domain-containing protein